MAGVFVLLLATMTVAQVNNAQTPVNFPNNYVTQLDLVYTKVGSWEGRLDIYHPSTKDQKVPLVINIHGGGWNHGTKESQTGFGSFFKKGFAVANIEYRLVHEGEAPAAVQDVRCALNYLYEHAEDFNVDRDRIILMGSSAGAHLAMLAGLLKNNTIFDVYCKSENNLAVFAIINKYGVSDLTSENVRKSKSVKNWLGTRYHDVKFVKSVSPIYYVDKNSPPIFMVHGDADPIVSYLQSKRLYQALLDNSVKTKLMTIKNGEHGKFSKEDQKHSNDELWHFLDALGL
ncbi:alpha/beta hydrolase [Gelidibacter maritimus]|uniref:alpha/beta hydrolase n=1 Tax=Gelidibacter maritimus TaxID=2761487 RepID=UPI001C714F18|nr:alpha/beta hydrolase [Gelidibacter maritimus]